MSSVRLRRLQSDFDKLQDYVRRHPRVRLVATEGDPPEKYQVEFHVRSLRLVNGELERVKTHLVEIFLPGSYPRLPPQCRMLTPIFHPNIAPHAICIGDHWSAGEPLWNTVMRIGEMIAYQSYNVKSPLNGEAARWVSENLDELPLDPVSMLAEELPEANTRRVTPAPRPAPPPIPAPAAAVMVAAEVPAAPVIVSCPSCSRKLRLPAGFRGKWVRCGNCQTLIPAPEA